jgi:UDPglucose 6-dehydrogenase
LYQVETLVLGAAMQRAMEPERYIIGAPAANHALPSRLREWHAAFGCPVFVMRFESAELTKLAINFFLVSSVTTTNVLAEVCEAIGAEWSDIVPALRCDRRIGQYAYLNPGLGLAGGNLERDLVTVLNLSKQHDLDDGVIRAWQSNSTRRRVWAEKLLERALLTRIADPLIAVWGLTYKPDTHSMKNSPALSLLQRFRTYRVRVHDPVANIDAKQFDWVIPCASPLEAVDGADALVVMTPWKEYRGVVVRELAARLRGSIVIDPYGALDEKACRAMGLTCYRLGC